MSNFLFLPTVHPLQINFEFLLENQLLLASFTNFSSLYGKMLCDSFTQEYKASTHSQTPHFPLTDKSTSYEYQTETIDTHEVLELMNKSLKRLTPMFEQALQENEMVNIFTDYLDIPEKGELSMFRSVEEELKVLATLSFPNISSIDGRLSQGKALCLQVNPKNKSLVAVSLSNSQENNKNGMNYGIVLLWELGENEPRYILRSPMECEVLKFNPTRPHLLRIEIYA